MEMALSCSEHVFCRQVERDLRILADPRTKTLQQEVAEEKAERQQKLTEILNKADEEYNKKRNKFQAEEDSNKLMEMIIKQDPWLQKPTVKIGDKLSLTYLLSSNCLIKSYYGSYIKVKTNQLSGKLVLLYVWVLSDLVSPYSSHSLFNANLASIYSIYSRLKSFEVVFIALGNNKPAFDKVFSRMPWLAIPHEDHQARDSFRQTFGIPYVEGFLEAFVVDQDGTVLQNRARSCIKLYGVESFPFTEKRIKEIFLDSRALWHQLVLEKQKPSLTTLFGNYVISSKGNQVPTSVLEGKTLGLFFFTSGTRGKHRASVLLELWKSLEKDGQHKNFEVVLMSDDGSQSSFVSGGGRLKRMFNCSIPWYTLPVGGDRKLRDIFRIERYSRVVPDEGYFIVLEPDKYEALSYFAFDILQEFGMDAYPFTLERAVAIQMKKQWNELVLENLIEPYIRLKKGYCYHVVDTSIPVTSLFGSRVILLFATASSYESGLFLTALKRMYIAKKGSDDNFEIIYLPFYCTSIDFDTSQKSVLDMPWFVIHPYSMNFSVRLALELFDHQFPPTLPAIAAFGEDGHLVTKGSNLIFKKEWNSSYPFIQSDMADEVHRELVKRHSWDLGRLYSRKTYRRQN